jgi:hypothetical protein
MSSKSQYFQSSLRANTNRRRETYNLPIMSHIGVSLPLTLRCLMTLDVHSVGRELELFYVSEKLVHRLLHSLSPRVVALQDFQASLAGSSPNSLCAPVKLVGVFLRSAGRKLFLLFGRVTGVLRNAHMILAPE